MSSSTQIQAQTFLDMIHLDVDFHIPKQTQTKDYFQQATKAQLLNQGKLTTSQINFPSKEDLLTSRKQQNPRTYIDQVENNTNVCSKSVINHSVQTDKVLSYQTESEAVPNKQLLSLTEQQILFMTKDQEHLSIGAQSLKKQTKSKQCKMIQAKQKSSSPQKSVLFGSPSMQTENFKEQSHLIQYKSYQQFQNYHQVSNSAFADLPKKNQSFRCYELSSANIMQNNKYTDSSKSYSNSNISIEENDDIQLIQPLNRVSAASCQQSSRSSISDQHNLVLIADNSEKQVLKNTNSKYQQLHNSSLENSCSDSHITNKVGLKSELQQKSTNIIIDNNVPQQQQLRSPKTIVKYSGHIDSNVNNFCSPNITNTTQAYKNQQMISNSDKIIRNAVMISKIQPQFSSIQDLSSVQNDKLKTDITKYKISNQFTEDQPNESPQKINRLFTLEDLAPITSENFERLNIGQGNILSNNHFTDALAKLEYQNNSSVVPIYNKSGDQVGFLDIKGQYQNVNNNQAPSLSQGLSPKDLVILNQIGRKKQTITVSQITLDMSPKPVLKNQQINQVQNTEKCNKLQRQLSQVQIKKQNFNYSRQKEQSSEVELSENNILNVETKLFNNSKDNLTQNVLQCDKVDQMNTTSSQFLNLELLPDGPQNPRSINDQLSQTFNEQDNIVVQENEQMEFELIKGQEQSINTSQKINPLFRIDYVCQKLSQQILYDYRENNKPYSNKDQVKQLKPHQEAINIKDIKLLENAVFSKAELITQQNKAKSLTLLYDRPLTQNKRTQSRQLNKQNYYTLEDYSKSIKSMNEYNPLFISPSKLLPHPLCRITDEIIFSQTLLSEFYDENLFSKPSHSQSVDFLFMFEKESKLFQPALLCQNNTQLSDQIIRQNTELLYFNMKDDNALAQLSIKSLLPQPNDVVFAIRVNACSVNKQPIRIFKLLEEQFHLDLPATNIYNGLYVKIPLVCRLKSYSWVLRTMNLLLDFRIKANNAYLIQHENEPDVGFENQCLDDKMNELHTFRKLAGMIGQETFIYPSDLLIQFARTRYGESNLILQFVFEFLVTLIYYQCSSEHSYLFARFFFNDFAPDFFLLYLEICVKMNLQFQYSAQTSHGNYLEQLSDYKIQTSRIPYLINALFHNWDDIRKFSITDLLQQEFDYDYHDLQHYVSIFQILPKIFSYYSLFRRISYQNSMLLFNYLARQENLVDAITIKQFRKMMELSQISFTNTQQNEFYFAFTRTAQSFHLSCVLNSRLLTQQQFGSLFICCQLGRFAAFSSSVLRGFVSTQIQRQISISKNMLADLELCLNTYLRMNAKCNQKAIYRIQKLLAIGYNDVSNYDYDASVSKLQLIVQNIIRLLSETSQGIELIFLNGLISCLRRILEI